jgi:hypothetical protein
MEVVINKCYGGFGLSLKGEEYYLNLLGKKAYFYKQDVNDKFEKFTKCNTDAENLFTFTFYRRFG